MIATEGCEGELRVDMVDKSNLLAVESGDCTPLALGNVSVETEMHENANRTRREGSVVDLELQSPPQQSQR